MLTCCAARSEAQRIVEILPDDSFIVEINGKEYRAINADKAREIQKLRIDFEAAQKLNQEANSQIATQAKEIDLLKKDVEIVGLQRDSFKADFERSQVDGKRNFELFMSERSLRQEASQFIPHGEARGFGGKILKVLDSSYAQAFWKMAVPTYQMVRCSR
jgi:hypothetical protein